MYRGQTLVCKLSFAFILYGNRSSTLYLTFHSFSLTQLCQSKQLILRSSFKVRGSAFSSPRLVQIPGGRSRRRKPGQDSLSGGLFQHPGVSAPFPTAPLPRLAADIFGRFLGRLGPSAGAPCVVPGLPRTSPARHGIWDVSWKSR